MSGLLTGAWVIDVMAVAGTVFLAALALLFPVWHAIDKARHKRSDALEQPALLRTASDRAETGTLKAVGK